LGALRVKKMCGETITATTPEMSFFCVGSARFFCVGSA